jgi:hypothetical protein
MQSYCATCGIAQLHIRRSSSSSMIFDPRPLSPGHGVNGKHHGHNHHQHYHAHSHNTSISIIPPRTSIQGLPVELISRIFEFGSDSPLDSHTFLVRPDGSYHTPPSSDFQVAVSHVCKRWRSIALSMASLWSTLHFQHPSHLDRARTFLERVTQNNRGQVIDVAMDMSTPGGSSLTPSEIHLEHFYPIFNIVSPHLARWRSYTLKVGSLPFITPCHALPQGLWSWDSFLFLLFFAKPMVQKRKLDYYLLAFSLFLFVYLKP